MSRIQQEPISVDAALEEVRTDSDGAVALFLGTVRDHNEGRTVESLEYEAFDVMAEREMEAIERQALDRFEVTRVRLVHRTGRLAIGEASVLAAVSAPHRAAAIDACRFMIDTLKQSVPIWKKEYFEGGEVWLEGSQDRSSQP